MDINRNLSIKDKYDLYFEFKNQYDNLELSTENGLKSNEY